MRTLLLALIFITTAHAQTSKLSSGSFQLHVRPQLVGIYQDFRQILSTFTDYPPEVLQLLNLMDRTLEHSRALGRNCPLRTQLACLPILSSLLEDTHELERLFVKYQGNVRFNAETGLSPVSGQRLWLQLDQIRAKLQRVLQVEVLALSAGRSGERVSTGELIKQIDQMEAYHDLIVVEFIPPKYQDDFRSAWMNFFRPLHRQAEIGGRVTFLTSNLDQLNFYWNLLNMRMTKRLKKAPEGMGGPLNAIQNRWNQVIRINYGQ